MIITVFYFCVSTFTIWYWSVR